MIRQTILVIEDEEKLRRVIGLNLSSAGFDVKAAGSAGIMGRLPETALAFQTTGQVTHEVATGPSQEHTPEHTIKFAVVGLDHSHINGITDTIRRSLTACFGSLRKCVPPADLRFRGRVPYFSRSLRESLP